jgi:hypothetical protein
VEVDVPIALFGTVPAVRRNWGAVAARAWKLRSWERVLNGNTARITPDAETDILIVGFPDHDPSDGFHAHLVFHGILDATRAGLTGPGGNITDHVEWFRRMRSMTIEALPYPWFSIGVIASLGGVWFPIVPEIEPEQRSLHVLILDSVLGHWDLLLQLERRFVGASGQGRWSEWWMNILPIAACAGLPTEDLMKLEEVGAAETKNRLRRLMDNIRGGKD